jgi:hypothetical protein
MDFTRPERCQRQRTGRGGPPLKLLRGFGQPQAAVEAAQQAYRPTNPWHRLYTDTKNKHGKTNPAKAAVARKILIAAWHILSREEPFTPNRALA